MFSSELGRLALEDQGLKRIAFDDAQGHYELVYSGRNGYRRLHGAVLHVDVRGDKVCIQHDGVEGGITGELLEAGIPPEHIVLAFHHPTQRDLTPFARA